MENTIETQSGHLKYLFEVKWKHIANGMTYMPDSFSKEVQCYNKITYNVFFIFP